MPRYLLVVSEPAFYRIEVEADSSEDAAAMSLTSHMALGLEPYDYGRLELRRVTLIGDTRAVRNTEGVDRGDAGIESSDSALTDCLSLVGLKS